MSTDIKVRREAVYQVSGNTCAKVESDYCGAYLWIYGKGDDVQFVKFVSREDAVAFFAAALECVE